jgi:hypothetical protein
MVPISAVWPVALIGPFYRSHCVFSPWNSRDARRPASRQAGLNQPVVPLYHHTTNLDIGVSLAVRIGAPTALCWDNRPLLTQPITGRNICPRRTPTIGDTANLHDYLGHLDSSGFVIGSSPEKSASTRALKSGAMRYGRILRTAQRARTLRG